MSPKKHIEKPRVPIMGDRGALLSIQSLLDGKEWDSEDLETVAEFCRLAGYRIDPPTTKYRVTATNVTDITMPDTATEQEIIDRVILQVGKLGGDWAYRVLTMDEVETESRYHDCPNCGGHREDEAT